jgi:predicted cupin superfamily sugar epimerase
MTADQMIVALNLAPHPEGGWYHQTWIADAAPGARPAGTAIYFLLKAGERSHWHKVDATEIWLWHGGAPLDLWIAETEKGPARRHRLCTDLVVGAPQAIVPPQHWQAAESTATDEDNWSLVSCTVSPGFQFDGFTLAPAGFDIPR